MNLLGSVKVNGYTYFLQMNDVKATMSLLLITPYHEDDSLAYEMQTELQYPLLDSEFDISNDLDLGYVAEAVKRNKASGRVFVFKEEGILETILNELSFANNYTFARTQIIQDEDYYYLNENFIKFRASDTNLKYEHESTNDLFTYLHIEHGDFYLHLTQARKGVSVKRLEFTEVFGTVRKNILTNTIKVIDYQMLCDSLDMSWYKDGDVYKKDYHTIKTIKDFELQVITPIVLGIKDAMDRNDQFDVTLDTETTGLKIYDLSKDNPDRDHCVAVPMSWKEDFGVVIFTDMEYFNNIPNEYVAKRLHEIFSKFSDDRIVEIWVPNDKVIEQQTDLQQMNLFSDYPEAQSETSDFSGYKKVVITIRRENINLIGHNAMFDGRVMFAEGATLYFDNDTLQMSFDINPTLVKGNNKLKVLTRRLFHHETPELTDILGKGNEDKYRYLSNEEVAKIYGCADGDYTLKVFHVLKKLMTKRMYAFYQKQDMPMENILYKSEFYGMQTIESLLQSEIEKSKGNLEILKNFIYEYVGAFVSIYKQRSHLDKGYKVGIYTKDQYEKAISEIKVQWGEPFIFELKASEIRKVLYEILKYPILGYTNSNLPKTDKHVIEKLVNTKRSDKDTHFTKLEKDILVYGADYSEYSKLKDSSNEKKQKKAESMVLISAKDFNKTKYPLALALQKYAELNKEYTSYFKPMEENNLEGKIFKNYSLARIETRRIMNPGQTMKGNLKALIRSYSDDYYVLDFDMSQVEYRIMLSLAGFMLMIDKMSDPEKDYHTETASLINNIPAHKVDKKTRKKAKSVSFGVPYGLGVRALCDKLFGVINEETLLATRMLLAKWEEANHPIMEFLNKSRDSALVERAMTTELRDFMDAWEKDENGDYVLDMQGNKVPKSIGFSYNALGFYRTYDLSNVSQTPAAKARRMNKIYTNEEGMIRRPAGNYPIQCFAAELFRVILIRFYNRCEEEGIQDKVIWHMLIHDELLCSVHKSIHPFFIYKIVKESCMITMKGHTKYFVGINIGDTWAETKDDSREAPVYFVDRMIKRWDNGDFGTGPFWFDHPWEFIKPLREEYVGDRIWEVLHEIQPNIDNEPINIPHILETFSNYTVRAYVNDYPVNYTVDKSKFDLDDKSEADEYQDRVWVARFETWALERFGAGKTMYDYDNRLIVLRDRTKEIDNVEDDDFEFVDYDELFDDNDYGTNSSGSGYWSFDEVEANNVYDSEYVFYNEDSLEDMYDFDFSNKNAKNVAQLLNKKHEFEHLKDYNEQIIISCEPEFVPQIKEYCKDYISSSGKNICFNTKRKMERWVRVKSKLNLKDLDCFISELYKKQHNEAYQPVNYKILNNQIFMQLPSDDVINELVSKISTYKSTKGRAIIVKTYLGQTRRLTYYDNIPLQELDSIVSALK